MTSIDRQLDAAFEIVDVDSDVASVDFEDFEAPTVAAGFVEGQHPRDREGQFAERVDRLRVSDKLKLGSRIDAEVVASKSSAVAGNSDKALISAMLRTPTGPELRLGIVNYEDTRKWKAGNRGGTVRLEGPAIAELARRLEEVDRDGAEFQKRLKVGIADVDALMDRVDAASGEERARLQRELDDLRIQVETDATFAEGFVPGSGWGDIAFQASGSDDGDGGWQLALAIRPPDAGPDWAIYADAIGEGNSVYLDPKHLRALRKQIETMQSEAEAPETAAAATHTGAMIALVPTDADTERLAVDDGEPAEELHLTMMYLGDAADLDPDTQAAVHAMCAKLAQGTAPIAGDGFALNVFNPHTTERDTALVMGVGGKELGSVQAAIAEWARRLASAPEQHAPFVPHVTLAYSDDLGMLPDLIGRLGPVGFDRLRVAFGDEVTDYPLTGMVDDSPFDADGWFAVTKGKIRIAQPGGFRRCVKALRDEPGVYDPEGLCATMHHRATGKWPGQKHSLSVAAADDMPTPEVLAEQLAYEDMIAEAVPGAMFHALMHIEGVSTGRRVYLPGALTWRTPPLPFNWAIESAMHGGQQKVIEVGLVTDVARADNEIHGWGTLDLDDPNALEYARKLAAGWVRGVSIGMDEQPVEVEYLFSPSDPGKVEQEIYLSGNIMELTSSGAVAQEAAYIEPLPALLEALAARGIEVAAAGFEEAEHPRDSSGKFAKNASAHVDISPSWDAINIGEFRKARAQRIVAEAEARDARFGIPSTPGSHERDAARIAENETPAGTRIYGHGANHVIVLPGVEVDPAAVVGAQETLTRLLRDFPLGGPVDIQIGATRDSHSGMGTGGDRRINISASHARATTPREGFGAHLMPAAQNTPEIEYTVAHEYGHALAADSGHVGQDLWETYKPSLSAYGQSDRVEGYAEAFAEWASTDGKTDNLASRAYASHFGWQASPQMSELS